VKFKYHPGVKFKSHPSVEYWQKKKNKVSISVSRGCGKKSHGWWG
jgi:hypothetical protein